MNEWHRGSERKKEGEREKGEERERENALRGGSRKFPLKIVIGTSGGTSDRWKIQPLSLAFNTGGTFDYNGSCVRPDECSN